MSSFQINSKRVIQVIVSILAVLLLGFIVWYNVWVNFVDNYQLGFTYNKMTGKIEVLKETGWIVRTPWVYDVHAIDLRPGQVTMNANSRVLNAKLVRFDPKGLETFVEWHGRAAGDNSHWLYEILKSYAFNVNNGTDCPFLIVVDELKKQGPALAQTGPESKR